VSDTPVYLYRVMEKRFAGPVDEYGDPIPGARGPLEVWLRAIKVEKITPKGWRLRDGRFVLASATKKYADPTIEGAFVSFYARKTKEARIYMARAAAALQAKRGAERLKDRLISHLEREPNSGFGFAHLPTDNYLDGVRVEAETIDKALRKEVSA
jgi:hypothetical protein